MIPATTMTGTTRSWLNFTAFLLIAAHLAIVLPQAYHLNIWVDEASTLYATQNGFWTAFQNAATEQKQAPLYFWIMSLWRAIDGSIFFSRLFSVIFSVAAIRLFAGLAWRTVRPNAALALTAFFALHPYLIWASLEIRVYAFVILLSVVLIRLFLTAFIESEGSASRLRYPKTWFLIAAIIALYSNYYLGFLLVGLFASLLITSRWRAALTYAFLMIVAGIAFFPLLFDLYSEFQVKSGGFHEPRTVIEGLKVIWNHVLTFVLPTEIFPPGEQTAVSWARVWLVRIGGIALIAIAVINRRSITRNTVIAGSIAGTVGVFLLVAYFLVGPLFIEIRHASVLFVPLLLFLGSLLTDTLQFTGKTRSAMVTAFAGILVLASFGYSIANLYPNMTKRGDWARVAGFIEQHESPGQPIVTFEAFDALALPYHYKGTNRILPDENYFDFTLQAAAGSAESMDRQNEFVISEIPSEAESVWLVVNEICLSTEACRPLENYVRSNYTIELEREFYLSKVYLLKRKP